jgi:sirohydrochlorin ferrochelatase
VRFREDSPEELARARAAVTAWRDENPIGTDEQVVAVLGHQFHRDYGPVLRAVLFVVDRHRARQGT